MPSAPNSCKGSVPNPFHTQVEAYLRAPGSERKAAAASFWAAFEDLRCCYCTYAPDFIAPEVDDAMPPSLSSYYLFRQKLHALLEAGSEVSAVVVQATRAMWAAHEICYEQHLRATGRDSVEWLSTFSASLENATRAHLLKLLENDFPDTSQLVAACTRDAIGTVSVADEFWTCLPLADISDEDIRTIERAIVGLYASSQEDGRSYHGALSAAMDPAARLKPAAAPTPTRVDDVALRAAVAVQPRRDCRWRSRGSGVHQAHVRMRSRDRKRPRHRGRSRSRHHCRSRNRRPQRSRWSRSRRSRSSIPRRLGGSHALMLVPRACSYR